MLILFNPGIDKLGAIAFGAVETLSIYLGKEKVDKIVNGIIFKTNVNIIKTVNERAGTILIIKS